MLRYGINTFSPNYREIDFNGLVGYIGGYVGLFLGYNLLQIPDLVLLLSAKAKKYFSRETASVARDLPQAAEV